MTIESVAFEQLNARVAKLLQGAGATVTWNAKIPDPDDPTQKRQIDVLIDKAGLHTGVECRHHDGFQSVMWVEELIGRKQSLKLDGLIGVAINGFTPLAQAKAKRYGIALYDFRALTDNEIASWNGSATVETTFVQLEPLVVIARLPAAHIRQLPASLIFRNGQMDGYAAVMDRVRDDAAAHQGQQRSMSLNPAGFQINGIPVQALDARYVGRLVPQSATCLAVQMMGSPGTEAAVRDISVQHYAHSVPQIIRARDEVHLVLDVSSLQPPPNSILHEFRVQFSTTTTLKMYELIGSRDIRTEATSIMLKVVPVF
jgi:Restriction endonuclease